MKKKILSIVIIISMLCCFMTACMSLNPKEYSGGDSLSEGGSEAVPSKQIPAGQLTAAEWNDLKQFDYWRELFESNTQQEESIFAKMSKEWEINTLNRIPVKVSTGTNPVSNAVVNLYAEDNGQECLFTARTNARGEAFLFPNTEVTNGIIQVMAGENSGEAEFTYSANMETVEVELRAAPAKEAILEIMFLIDATGSMGDEISYLKSEIADVISRVTENSGITARVALLLYRDYGDEYVTKYFAFSENIAAVQTELNKVYAAGGGDFPEAVDVAVSEAVSKQWGSGNVTRLIIHVLDAPPHSNKNNKELFYESIIKAAELGICMIPILSSGADSLTEFLMRSEAIITGGTFIFLTDDSGIGNSHLEPSIGSYVVEYLNDLLVRVINEYCTGTAINPVPYYKND